MAAIDGLLDFVARVFRILATACLATMVAINLVNVIWRGVFDDAFGWIFGWTMLLFVWMLLLGFFVYIRTGRDVEVDIFMTRLPRGGRRFMGLFTATIGVLVMLAILRGAPALLALQTARMDTIALPIWVRTAPLFVSAMLVLLHFLNQIVAIMTGRHEPFVRDDDPVSVGAVE